jgi:hypothetical protein
MRSPQKVPFVIAIAILLLSAILLPFALPQLPFIARLVISSADVLGAVIIYALMRQRFSQPPSS